MKFKNIIIYLIVGLAFGFYNEFYFAPMWEYSDWIQWYVKIPGWAMLFAVLMQIPDILKFHIVSRICFLQVVFSILEFVFSRFFKWWEYKYWIHENLFFMGLGYLLVMTALAIITEYFKEKIK